MKCPMCDGEGFKEYEHGLIQVGCQNCEGTGEIPDVDPKYLIIPEALPGKTMDETADIAREIIKASKEKDDSNSGDRPDNKPTRSKVASKRKQPSKPKASRKTTKRSG